MKLIEIKQYSTYLYVPKSKEDIRGDERKKYIKRLDLGYGIIDVEFYQVIQIIEDFIKKIQLINIYEDYYKIIRH